MGDIVRTRQRERQIAEGHTEHELASENGSNVGFDMYDPEEQHP